MGDGEIVATPTYTEVFEEVFPYYLAMGMSYEQFWFDEPKLAVFYRKSDEIRKRRMNEELWLSGIYTAEALASTVGNMFTKGEKHNYPSEPKPITLAEIEERKVRDQKLREEQIKARFTARALSVNATKGVKHDH